MILFPGAKHVHIPRLLHATAEERNSWRLIGEGRGIHCAALDEDISVAKMFVGQPSAGRQAFSLSIAAPSAKIGVYAA